MTTAHECKHTEEIQAVKTWRSWAIIVVPLLLTAVGTVSVYSCTAASAVGSMSTEVRGLVKKQDDTDKRLEVQQQILVKLEGIQATLDGVAKRLERVESAQDRSRRACGLGAKK